MLGFEANGIVFEPCQPAVATGTNVQVCDATAVDLYSIV
jgi:hypothetical protein